MTTPTKEMSELTRCLCGGNAGHIQREAGMMGAIGYDRWHAVRCQSFGLTLGESDRRFRSKAEAGKAWNALMSKAAQDTEAQACREAASPGALG